MQKSVKQNKTIVHPKKKEIPYGQVIQNLKQQAPKNFEVWYELQQKAENAYKNNPTTSLSVEGNEMANYFKYFIYRYLSGNILDIGCGPQPIPIYLEGFPPENIYGLDPFDELGPHTINFVKGIAETIPYEDSQFNIAISATSLDHVLLLDKSIQEIHRILIEDGKFLLWAYFITGAKKYNPYENRLKPVDEYHLFHLDKEWFLEELAPYFTIEKYFTFGQNTFMVLKKIS